MAVNFIEVTGGEQFALLAKNFESASKEELATALNTTLQEGTKVVKSTIREANAVASGITLNSVVALINQSSQMDWRLAGEIGFEPPADKYVDYADDGRGSGGMPPLSVIRAWTRIKGIDQNLAYPIARKIGARGTGVGGWSSFGRRTFLKTATGRVDQLATKEFNKIAARLQKRIDANASNSSRST